MYDINSINFGEKLREFRKTRKLSLEDLGTKINKSKATISKYEANQIVPDFITVLEICNALEITLSQLFPSFKIENLSNSKNQFSSNILYLYYYTDDLLITSVMELKDENNMTYATLFNGIRNIKKYASENAYSYFGTLETDKTIGYFNLTNTASQDTICEKLQISFNIPWSSKIEITNFFILGLTPNSAPIVKKGIISTSPIENLDKFEEDLKISSYEIFKLQHDNGWILENKNYAHFFFDK